MIGLFSSLFRRGTGIPGKVEKPEFIGAALREQGSGIQPDAGGLQWLPGQITSLKAP